MHALKFLVLAWVVGLAACATESPRGFVAGAPVTVTVTADGDIVVDQEPIPVRGSDVVLNWTLVSPESRYSFTANGIEITRAENAAGQPVPIPPGEFECGPLAQGKKFQCKDKNSTHGQAERRYKYTITVQRGTDAPRKLDPWINNF